MFLLPALQQLTPTKRLGYQIHSLGLPTNFLLQTLEGFPAGLKGVLNLAKLLTGLRPTKHIIAQQEGEGNLKNGHP